MRVTLTLAAVILTAAIGTAAVTTAPQPIAFPEGYERWTRVKTTLVGPASPAFAIEGGFHHFYANDKALDGYRTGVFPDGSVLVDDRLEAADQNGVSNEGPRARVAVMVKDRSRFARSKNWGFEVFARNTRTASLDGPGKAACLACHQRAGRDLVFSQLDR
jgi:hypothetical protein